ncbi:MAG: RDD family protein [Balneolaceae bacterium]
MNQRGQFAGFWKRFAAHFIDQVLLSLIILFVAGVLGLAAGATVGTPEWGLYGMPSGFITSWIYYAVFESSVKQATPGKLALSLKVIDLDHNRISFGRATGRYFGKILSAILLLIGYLMQPFTAKKQTMHDLMAGTLIVDETRYSDS